MTQKNYAKVSNIERLQIRSVTPDSKTSFKHSKRNKIRIEMPVRLYWGVGGSLHNCGSSRKV